MKQHRFIWSVTLIIALAAVSVAVTRQMVHHRRPAPPPPEALVDEALTRLERDPVAWEPATQSAVRVAATQVEEGAVKTPEGYCVLALQYQRESNVTAAEAYYKRAIALRPDWSWPYAGLGSLLGRHSFGRRSEAEEALRKAIALEPGWARPHNILAVVLRLDQRLDEAEEEARTALRLDPDDLASHNNYANLLVALGRFDEAEAHYGRAIALNPKHPKPYYNLACLCSLLGRRDEALTHLADALRRAPVLRGEAATDPDLIPLRTEPAFRRLVYGDEDMR